MMTTPYRNAMIAKVQIARKSLALDDATYRAMLAELTGKTSCANLSAKELQAVLAELRRKGWNPAFKRSKPRSDSGPRVAKELIPLRNKIAAQLADLERPWSYADGILSRMYGQDVGVGTATRTQLTACVTALTRQQTRETA